ncbi:hypothetical protein E2C01_057028 [Portunus trituberculatus]|uniref:Uncharacterized protein n=1 Tax=Portunus trituberculatus TaxID=210409 RepID=A0A5B7H0Q3_PORTR|nr:hypothetical protein [Portunus trituberculatus]
MRGKRLSGREARTLSAWIVELVSLFSRNCTSARQNHVGASSTEKVGSLTCATAAAGTALAAEGEEGGVTPSAMLKSAWRMRRSLQGHHCSEQLQAKAARAVKSVVADQKLIYLSTAVIYILYSRITGSQSRDRSELDMLANQETDRRRRSAGHAGQSQTRSPEAWLGRDPPMASVPCSPCTPVLLAVSCGCEAHPQR